MNRIIASLLGTSLLTLAAGSAFAQATPAAPAAAPGVQAIDNAGARQEARQANRTERQTTAETNAATRQEDRQANRTARQGTAETNAKSRQEARQERRAARKAAAGGAAAPAAQ